MDAMKKKLFLRKRNGIQQHGKSKNDAVQRTLDLSDSVDRSSSTLFPSPIAIHQSDTCSLASVSETQADAGDNVSTSNPQTVVEGPPLLAMPGTPGSEALQSTAATLAVHRKSGKVKQMWKKACNKVTFATRLRGSKRPADSITPTQTPIPVTTDVHSTSISSPTSRDSPTQIVSIPNSPAQLVAQNSASTTIILARPNGAVVPGQGALASASRSTTTSTLRANAVYVVAILKDLGEILDKIPYVKALAGTTLVILRMWEEMEDVADLTSELVEDVWRRSVELIETLKTFTTEDGQCLLNGRLESQLQSYQTLLENIAADLVVLKQQSPVVRLAKRLKSRKMIERHRRRLQEFDSAFSAAALLALLRQVDKLVERNEATQNAEVQDHARVDASQSIADTMAFVVNEILHKNLIATDGLVMRRFVTGVEGQMLLECGKIASPFFFFF